MTDYKRIIIIDDDNIVTTICKYLIKKHLPEMEVASFLSPLKGVEYIKEEYTSLPVKSILLLDINMPGMNGWEVLDELDKLDSAVVNPLTVYMFSSSISMDDKKQSLDHPLVLDFIEKPLTIEKLQQIIR